MKQMNEFLRMVKVTRSMNTFVGYKTAMNKIAQAIEDKPIGSEVILQTIDQWKDCLTNNTIRQYLIVLSQYLKFTGSDTEWLSNIIKSLAERHVIQPCPTETEFETILHSITGHKYRAILLLMAKSGCRVSEVVSLRLSDVDLARGIAVVRDTKNSEDKYLRLSSDTIDEIRAYMDYERKPISPTKLFTSAYGEQTIIATQLKIKRCCEKVGLDKYHCHSFRHYFAQRLIDNNCSLPIVQKAMGHKSSKSTEKYFKVNFNTVMEAVDEVFN